MLWAREGLGKQEGGLEVIQNRAKCHIAKGELMNLGDEADFSLHSGAHKRELKGERPRCICCVQLICGAAGEKENVTLKCHKQNSYEEIFKHPVKCWGNLFGNVPWSSDLRPKKAEFESQQVQQTVAGKGRRKGAYFRQGHEKYPLRLAKEVGRGRDACL